MTCALLGNIIKKRSTERFESKEAMRFLFNCVVSISCATSLFLISGVPKISGFTLMLGILFGLITFVQFVFILMSYEFGPFSYTSVIISLSMVIPALSGYFIWGEKIAPVQIAGMLLMLVCFSLSVDFGKDSKKASGVWFLFVFLAFLTTGFIGIMQKWHQSSEYKDELDGFLTTAFLFSFIFSALGFIVTVLLQRKRKTLKPIRADLSPLIVILMALCGIFAAANNKLNLYLSGVMDSAVFFPIVNGGGMLLSAMVSLFIFKEKFTRQKWLGIIIGITAVIMICNPF